MRRKSGFTLIELLIVIAVIGILAKIALPQFFAYMLRSKMTEAFNTLSDQRVKLEQYYQDNRNYGPTAGGACGIAMPTAPTVKYFSYTCTIPSANPPGTQGFLLTATSTAVGGMGAAGSYAFTIDQNDVKQTTAFVGASGLPLKCWISSKASSC